MRSYNQFCPVAKAAELFCERWTALIIRDLAEGPLRFSQLQRGVPLASPTILSRRLRQLEAEGIVERRPCGDGGGAGYALTEAGGEFVPVVMALAVWGQRWSRRDLADHEVDLGLLLWALEKGARPDSFGARRTVIELELTDQPAHKRRWWFLNENGRCELCVDPPDTTSDLYVTAMLVDMIRIWRGDITVATALDTGRLTLHGDRAVERAFPTWLARAAVADVPAARADSATVA